ncbi:Copper-containing nitrite reductase (modular protein) [Hyphomicrobiales bacterium]|nr:Copper-containing nitrite reductase (modular protein) [Hyphomicrobiales bacterium]CAH1701439.1 Copper-containing nitrite reductase (modular protein) [Hyphomicrobiales bacterium]CAI0345397.1 Copper-containing nitrite reductase (modular protein) [Hyphomicrobiales bacterium]
MANATATDIAKLPRVKPKLVDPPFVHAHEQIATGGPKVVEFTMTIHEKKIVLDDAGTETFAFTFNGTVPGPLMVVHEGDYIELTLINAETNELMHNIEFHSSTGALGGGALTEVNPGERVVLRWKATRQGVFVYHCAPPGMVPWHVTAGMNGAIMIAGIRDEGRSARRTLSLVVLGIMQLQRERRGLTGRLSAVRCSSTYWLAPESSSLGYRGALEPPERFRSYFACRAGSKNRGFS